MPESLQLILVEADDHCANLMRGALEDAGHRITLCHTAADALIVLSQGDFGLVLLDQRLPDMTGLEVLAALFREGIAVPVLFLAGDGDERLATQVLRAGALDYVVKDHALAFLADLPKRVADAVSRHRLQQANRLLIEAIESARDAVMITDLAGTILHVNAAFEAMLGYPRAELLGKNPRLFKSDVHPPHFHAGLWKTILGRAAWTSDIVNRRKDGALVEASLAVSPIIDGRGRLTHFVGIYRDMSERRLIETKLVQAQKMQSVGRLAGGVAHEFNNLLAGIQGYATLGLREPVLPGEVRDFLTVIVQLSERAANLTRQLLAFARKPALSRRRTSLAELLHATADLVRQTLKMEIDVAIQPGAAEFLALADANQLQQVLVNLALNARDAMPQGASAVFRLSQRRLPQELLAFPEPVPPGDYVVIEVEDRGKGMTPEVLAQSADPFFTTKDIGEGTGLGLSVALGIVQGHQGFLTIASEAAKGTLVCIFLPRLAQAPTDEPRDSALVLEPEPQQSRSVLVIDDEPAVLDVVRRLLEIAGHRVYAATSAAAALAAIGDCPVDLVILDLMIPREQGSANFRLLRDRLPATPILVCTGMVQTEEAQALLEGGGAGLLRKPFRMNELWHAVSQCLNPPG